MTTGAIRETNEPTKLMIHILNKAFAQIDPEHAIKPETVIEGGVKHEGVQAPYHAKAAAYLV